MAWRVRGVFCFLGVDDTDGGNSDEKNQQDHLKQAFEARFPGMTLNLTVDLSKYHDINVSSCHPTLPVI